MEIDKRFVYSGHAIGAAAHFHRLDDLENLEHIVPNLASSVLSPIGGLSQNHHSDFSYQVDHPRKRELLSVKHTESKASGKQIGDLHETEVYALARYVDVVDMLHVDLVEVHQKARRAADSKPSTAYTTDARIEGMRLGNVTVDVQLDGEPFAECGTMDELNGYFGRMNDSWRREHAWRFHTPPAAKEIQSHNGKYFSSLVRKIDVAGPEEELKNIEVKGYSIRWHGFGTIFLGEVVLTDKYRAVTMIRLKMGSSAGGHASIASVQSDSATMP